MRLGDSFDGIPSPLRGPLPFDKGRSMEQLALKEKSAAENSAALYVIQTNYFMKVSSIIC